MGTLVELVTPTLPGIEIAGDDDKDVDEATDEADDNMMDEVDVEDMDEIDDEAEGCTVVTNELAAEDDTVKDAEDVDGVTVGNDTCYSEKFWRPYPKHCSHCPLECMDTNQDYFDIQN